MRIPPLSLAIATLVLLITTSSHAAPPPLPDTATFPNSMGVNIHFTDPQPGELEQIYAAGFRWVRMDFGWGGIERKKGEYDFSAYDRLLAALDAHHIKAYFILDYSNANYDNDLSPHSDEGRAAFATWAAASVRHFKGHGILWEMYNEPNIMFWRPKTNVDDYIKLALETGKAIRDAEPGEIYIGPATSTIDMAFLEACFKAGCLEYWSAVSVHPYRQQDPETVTEEYRAVRKLIAKYAAKDRKIPIISGEWGYSSVWDHFDEDRQAKYLPREIMTNIANDIPFSIWYDWHEDGKDPKEGEHHFGIVRPDAVNKDGNLYEPKKAFLAAKQMQETLSGYRFNKRLAIGAEDVYVLLFDNPDGKIILANWTTSDAKLDVPLPITGGATIRRSFGTADTKLPADAKGIRLTPDDFPTYILPTANEELLHVAAAWSRVAAEIPVTGPAMAHAESIVRNPLDHPITLVIADKKTVVMPGEMCSIDAQAAVTRSAVPVPLLPTINIEGMGRVSQRTTAIVTNPLTAMVFPRVGDTQQVRIDNPAGDAFAAAVKMPGSGDASLIFQPGEHTKTVSFKFSAKQKDSDGEQISVTRSDGVMLLDVRGGKYTYIRLTVNYAGCINWKIAADGDAHVASTQTLADASPADGPPAQGADCVKIVYRFEKGWKFAQVVPMFPMKFSNAAKLGLWVYGDASANVARMRFTDSTDQTFQPDGGAITWAGWRYIEFPFTARDLAHWGGANDGVVHYPIHIDTLFLLDSPKREATHGEIYLSTPTVVYGK